LLKIANFSHYFLVYRARSGNLCRVSEKVLGILISEFPRNVGGEDFVIPANAVLIQCQGVTNGEIHTL